MAWLKHKSDTSVELNNQQILGDDSPLQFDDDGFAEVADRRTAERLAAMHRHIELGGHGPSGGSEGGEQTLDDMTKEELYEIAKEREIPDRSDMDKDELRDALRED